MIGTANDIRLDVVESNGKGIHFGGEFVDSFYVGDDLEARAETG